jgi:hypothetical protein
MSGKSQMRKKRSEESEEQEEECDTEFEKDLFYGREALLTQLGPVEIIEEPTYILCYDRAPRINWPVDPST